MGHTTSKCTVDELRACTGLPIDEITWEDSYSRGFCDDDCPMVATAAGRAPDRDHTHWVGGSLKDGRTRRFNYYCPGGWYRHSIKPPAGVACFGPTWTVLYHGTTAGAVPGILRHGFEAKVGCCRVCIAPVCVRVLDAVGEPHGVLRSIFRRTRRHSQRSVNPLNVVCLLCHGTPL